MSADVGPWLIVLSGLPAVGKTTIAREIAEILPAAHLRIDTIEAAMLSRGFSFDGPQGDAAYVVAYAIAADLLRLGQSVVVDAVHGWDGAEALVTAATQGLTARVLRVALTCSRADKHRHRAETRVGDIPDLPLPSWEQILARSYVAPARPDLQIDTATISPSAAAALVLKEIS